MNLPKVKNRKLIQADKFIKLAKKVAKSFEEEENYLREQKARNENNLLART